MAAQFQISSPALGSRMVVVEGFVRKETLLTVQMPALLTPLKNFPTALISGATIYGDYQFRGSETIGRGETESFTKLTFIPIADPVDNPPFSTSNEYDPITNDIWLVERTISVSPVSAQSLWNVTTASQMENGLWMNTSRTLTTQLTARNLEQSDEFQQLTKTAQYIQTPVAALAPLGYLVENSYDAKFIHFGLHRTSTFNGPITKTDKEFDPETFDPVTITRTLTLSGLLPPSPGSEITLHQINEGLTLVVTRTIAGGGGAVPHSRSLAGYSLWEIPTLLLGVAIAVGTRADGLSVVKTNPSLRAGGWRDLPSTEITDYFTTPPTPSDLWIPITKNIAYSGFVLPIPTLQRVLCDTLSTIFINLPDTDPEWPSLHEEFAISATTPISTTQYLAAVADTGTQKLVKEEVAIWRYQLYKRQRTFISPK